MDDDPLKLDDDPLKQNPVQGNVWLIVGGLIMGNLFGGLLLGDGLLGMLLGLAIASVIAWLRQRNRWKE